MNNFGLSNLPAGFKGLFSAAPEHWWNIHHRWIPVCSCKQLHKSEGVPLFSESQVLQFMPRSHVYANIKTDKSTTWKMGLGIVQTCWLKIFQLDILMVLWISLVNEEEENVEKMYNLVYWPISQNMAAFILCPWSVSRGRLVMTYHVW